MKASYKVRVRDLDLLHLEPLIKDYIDAKRRKDEERFKREAELAKEIEEKGKENVTLPLEPWSFRVRVCL